MTDVDLPGLAARLEACADYPKQYTTEAVVDCETLREAAQALRAASAPDGVVVKPCAWRVLDAAGEWVLFHNETHALHEAALLGAKIEPLYAAPQSFTSGHIAEGEKKPDTGQVRGDYPALLKSRDDFIVSKGLWSEFVDTLPRRPSDPSPAPVGDAAFGCKRAGGFVDHNCMAACDCDRTMRFNTLTAGEKASAVAEISDQDMRDLLSSKDVGTGRAKLRRLLNLKRTTLATSRDRSREALENVRDYLIPRAKFINGNPDKKNAEHVLLDQVEEALGGSHE